MASFLSSLSSTIGDMLKSALSGSSPYEVCEISPQQLSKCQLLQREGVMVLYKDSSYYFGVIQSAEHSSKAFMLFRVNDHSEALRLFSALVAKMEPLVISCRRIMMPEMLQEASELIRKNPTWTCAHVAAKMGLSDAFRNPTVSSKGKKEQNPVLMQVNEMCEETQVAPIHLAIINGNLETIQELLVCGVQLDLADHRGDNVFHFAAKSDTPKVVQMLASKNPGAINQLNLQGESPLHVACLENRPENVEQMLRWDADPCLTMSKRYPIHCAMKVASKKCVEVLCRWRKSQIHLQDKEYGGTPLHWCKSKECIYYLTEMGCNIDAENYDGETPLHIAIRKNRWECFMGLLSRGASAAKVAKDGNNCLHLAIEVNNKDMVQALIVFGADINASNHFSVSPRHMVANMASADKDRMLYYLHRVGAKRCEKARTDCEDGCKADGKFNGTPAKDEIVTSPSTGKEDYETMVDDVAMAAALTRSASASASESAVMGGSDSVDFDGQSSPSASGDRILCLDGGGIRGLVLIQLLKAIEKAAGQPIRNCFDWISGTSTGGILALAIVHGKPIEYIQGFYFRLKDEVFAGKRPYDSEPLEKCLKREFGESTRMTSVEYPRVMVTGVLADRFPAELHFFRNYEPPGFDYNKFYANSQFDPPPRATTQKVWEAGRSSGAAPTYFRSMGRFLDGGLMANNPTLDALTEVHEYNMKLRATNQGDKVKPIHVVVSLGTGGVPKKKVKTFDVYRPEGLFDIAKVAFGATALGELLVEQATQSEGRPVERARAWCSMIHVPFHRLSPQLSENIPLDCKDDRTLINMLWETQCYINEHWDRITKVAKLLKE